MHMRVIHLFAIVLIAFALIGSGANAVTMSHGMPSVAQSDLTSGDDVTPVQPHCAETGTSSQSKSDHHSGGSSCCQAMCSAVVLLPVFADHANALSLSRAPRADLHDLHLPSHDDGPLRRPPKA